MIGEVNFVGNAINLGAIAVDKLTAWMDPHQSSFNYSGNRLRFGGLISDEEMLKPTTNLGHDNTMAMKKGSASDLTIGRLNTIRAFVRRYPTDGHPGKMSKEVCMFPRNSKSGSFSACGDFGSAVIDGIGRVCGIITGGDGSTDDSDCTFVTSINFLLKRLESFSVEVDIFPLAADLCLSLHPHSDSSPFFMPPHSYKTYFVSIPSPLFSDLYLIHDDIWIWCESLLSDGRSSTLLEASVPQRLARRAQGS